MSRPVVAYGIDVSEHNGNMYFASLNPRPDFVIVRACWGTNPDYMADNYRKQLENLGIPYGVYLYSYALSVDDAEAEAHYLLNMIKDWKVEVGVWFDMEDMDSYKANHGAMDPSLISEMCNKFCTIVEDAGYYAGIYASLSWFGNYILGNERFDKWVAYWGYPNDGVKRTDTSDMGTMQQYSTMYGSLDMDCTFEPLSIYNLHPAKEDKTLDEYAVECWEGKYGNGEERYNALKDTSYGYDSIQNKVEEYGDLASKIWAGEYGNGAERYEKLASEGYDPDLVQRVVNVYG